MVPEFETDGATGREPVMVPALDPVIVPTREPVIVPTLFVREPVIVPARAADVSERVKIEAPNNR